MYLVDTITPKKTDLWGDGLFRCKLFCGVSLLAITALAIHGDATTLELEHSCSSLGSRDILHTGQRTF